ncbi:hypothetical protein BS47DRAFT_1402157 [Hydnum rufescens UP504]|uniref:Uncharacterized protein n=1 Tax=Hydnum rufescens UP504 TaxID=1448309 RepID=A0A9P6DLY4_9AGAM|nr:hypothetical protein BS47DRAFT_1402157 [Hydnum rufescens UP504]
MFGTNIRTSIDVADANFSTLTLLPNSQSLSYPSNLSLALELTNLEARPSKQLNVLRHLASPTPAASSSGKLTEVDLRSLYRVHLGHSRLLQWRLGEPLTPIEAVVVSILSHTETSASLTFCHSSKRRVAEFERHGVLAGISGFGGEGGPSSRFLQFRFTTRRTQEDSERVAERTEPTGDFSIWFHLQRVLFLGASFAKWNSAMAATSANLLGPSSVTLCHSKRKVTATALETYVLRRWSPDTLESKGQRGPRDYRHPFNRYCPVVRHLLIAFPVVSFSVPPHVCRLLRFLSSLLPFPFSSRSLPAHSPSSVFNLLSLFPFLAIPSSRSPVADPLLADPLTIPSSPFGPSSISPAQISIMGQR